MVGKGTKKSHVIMPRSKDRHNQRRFASGKHRDGDKREPSDQFETIMFESITVDFIRPQAQPANKVFVTVNVDLHSISSRPTALKAKLDTGTQGNTSFETVAPYVS